MPADDTALTAPNQSVQARNGVSYAHRRFGHPAAGVLPLVILQHFRGNLDNWDPLLLDTLAATREVIPVGNTGAGLSTGTAPRTAASSWGGQLQGRPAQRGQPRELDATQPSSAPYRRPGYGQGCHGRDGPARCAIVRRYHLGKGPS
jgi:hypothetical protein